MIDVSKSSEMKPRYVGWLTSGGFVNVVWLPFPHVSAAYFSICAKPGTARRHISDCRGENDKKN